ncbi:MAG: hypothetical protein U5O39_20115 [Gammaproteobacteria bacterium]|nr:hypothetical protein [Gammaproteobacteria bacterium]
MSPLDLMRLYVETANRLDDLGRMFDTNDGLQSPAPKLFYGATSRGACWYFGHEVAKSNAEHLDSLLKDETQPYAPNTPLTLECHEEVLKRLKNDANELRIETGPFYWYPDPTEVFESTELLGKDDEHRLRETLSPGGTHYGFCSPSAASLDGEEVAAICCSVRKRSAAHIAGCETESKFRRRGHATKAVTRWANAVPGTQRGALYNTTWANAASRKTAAATKAVQFAVGIAIY